MWVTENITMPPPKTSKKEVEGASVSNKNAREAKLDQATRSRKQGKQKVFKMVAKATKTFGAPSPSGEGAPRGGRK